MVQNNNTPTIDRKKIMARAWAMHRETNAPLKACIRKAWDLARLGEALHKGVVNIVYLKKDGTTRKAQATLRIGPGLRNPNARPRTESPKVFTYWDLRKADFRCFKCENLISWYL